MQWKSGDQEYDSTNRAQSVNAATTTYRITGLTAGTIYEVEVRAIGTGGGFLALSEGSGMTAPDLEPTFSSKTIDDLAIGQNLAMVMLTLPEATGGNGALSYTLTGPGDGTLPLGLTFDAAKRQLSGTPTATQDETTYTYKVTDSDTSSLDSAKLTFTIAIFAGLTNLTVAAVDGSTTELQASWNAATGAARYQVWWRTGNRHYHDTPERVTATTYKITSLMAGTDYVGPGHGV